MGAFLPAMIILIGGLLLPWFVISLVLWLVARRGRRATEQAAAVRREQGPVHPQEADAYNAAYRRGRRSERIAATSLAVCLVVAVVWGATAVVFRHELNAGSKPYLSAAGSAPQGTDNIEEMTRLLSAAVDSHNRSAIDGLSCTKNGALGELALRDSDIKALVGVAKGTSVAVKNPEVDADEYEARLAAPATAGGAEFRVTVLLQLRKQRDGNFCFADLVHADVFVVGWHNDANPQPVPGLSVSPDTCGVTPEAFRHTIEEGLVALDPRSTLTPAGVAGLAFCSPGQQERVLAAFTDKQMPYRGWAFTPVTVEHAPDGQSLIARTNLDWNPLLSLEPTEQERQAWLAQTLPLLTVTGVPASGRPGFVVGTVSLQTVSRGQMLAETGQ